MLFSTHWVGQDQYAIRYDEGRFHLWNVSENEKIFFGTYEECIKVIHETLVAYEESLY